MTPHVSKFWSHAKIEMRPPSVRPLYFYYLFAGFVPVFALPLLRSSSPPRSPSVPRLTIGGCVQFGELGAVQQSFQSIVKSAQKMSFLNLTVNEAAVNVAVAAEVLCWFYVGEMIGRRSIIGYDA